MAQITFTQDVRHNRDFYAEGSSPDLDDALAGYFVGNGWAVPGNSVPVDGETTSATSPVFPEGAPQDIVLEIQDVNHDQEVTEHG